MNDPCCMMLGSVGVIRSVPLPILTMSLGSFMFPIHKGIHKTNIPVVVAYVVSYGVS